MAVEIGSTLSRFEHARIRLDAFKALRTYGTIVDGKHVPMSRVEQQELADEIASWAIHGGTECPTVMLDADLYGETR